MGLESPIVIIGPHRSGTTWLGQSLGCHPDLAYSDEPRHIWEWGNRWRKDDRLEETDATPRIVQYIRRRFSEIVAESDKRRLVEKSPVNCLRVPFIYRVMPDARFVFLIRDGRSVIRGTRQASQQVPLAVNLRWRMKTIRLRDWPAYLSRIHWPLLYLMRRPLKFWGPRPPGWKSWVQSDAPLAIGARQWAAIAQAAHEDLTRLPASSVLTVRYEDMIDYPAETARRIAEFAAIDEPAPFVSALVEGARPELKERWRSEFTEDELALIRPLIEPVLESLGYRW